MAENNSTWPIRKAKIQDVVAMHHLINELAEQGDMLPRALSEMYENLRDYYVVDNGGRVVACCALHICWEDLAEIRSLAVDTGYRKRGLGRALVECCLAEASDIGLGQVFTLTLRPQFFERVGFRQVDMGSLPRKIWGECFHCPKFPNCDEVAMVRRPNQAAETAATAVTAAGG